MCETGDLFLCNIEGELLWMAYLEGFVNPAIFRDPTRNVYDCNYCKNFIVHYGKIVAINENLELMSIFDVPEDDVPAEYRNSIKNMADLIHNQGKIQSIFVETVSYLTKAPYEFNIKADQPTYKIGVKLNVKKYAQEDIDRHPQSPVKLGEEITFHHLNLTLPGRYVKSGRESKDELMSLPRSTKDVFARSMAEIPENTYQLVLDLEEQGSLLNGASYKETIKKALEASHEYNTIPEALRDNWCWKKSLQLKGAARFRSTAIGNLLVDLAEGKPLNVSCEAFNKIMDPTNYMKATAPITKAQIERAKKFVEENGYTESFERRCATIQDIEASEILHSNIEAAQIKTKVSLFDKIAPTAEPKKVNNFDKVEEIGIDDFMKNILHKSTSLEVYLSNKHKGNFVTLITSENKDSKHLFKWDNNFSWTYTGNLAGKSQIKQAVKAAGGQVEAPFRFSIMWNDKNEATNCDLDAHARESNGTEIYYASYKGRFTNMGGMLDVDIIHPGNKVAVENIFWKDMSKLRDGEYKFWIHNYNSGENQGAKAEIFVEGQTYQYVVNRTIKNGVANDAIIATVILKGGKVEKIIHGDYFVGKGEEIPEDVYGLRTCEFHKVSLACLSPNFWQEHGVGNKHYFFMLEGAMSPEDIRTIHNEYLNQDLTNHRKVLDALGSKLKCKSVKGQLSGLGFNATVRDDVILRVKGEVNKVVKVKF